MCVYEKSNGTSCVFSSLFFRVDACHYVYLGSVRSSIRNAIFVVRIFEWLAEEPNKTANQTNPSAFDSKNLVSARTPALRTQLWANGPEWGARKYRGFKVIFNNNLARTRIRCAMSRRLTAVSLSCCEWYYVIKARLPLTKNALRHFFGPFSWFLSMRASERMSARVCILISISKATSDVVFFFFISSLCRFETFCENRQNEMQ